MNCGDPNTSIDILMLGPTLRSAGFCTTERFLLPDGITEDYANYSVPVVMTYGCEANKNPDFAEVGKLYGDNVTKTFSGGIAQGWFDDASSQAMGMP
jgi:hypothetical protein